MSLGSSLVPASFLPGSWSELRCFRRETETEYPTQVWRVRDLWKSSGPTSVPAGFPRAEWSGPCPGEFRDLLRAGPCGQSWGGT